MSAVLAEAGGHGAWLEPLFDVAFTAPDGMARLRQLILTLAMHGKLVPQLASEAPASTLLKQIAAEKSAQAEKLHVSGEISPISNSEKPYTIPGSWEWVRLGEITNIIRGITFPASEKTKEPAPSRIACLRTANVQKEIEWQDLLYIDREFMSKSSQLIRRDDIVMSMANSRELVGKVAIVKDMPVDEATFGGFLGVLRTHKVMPLYVLHLLNTKYARGTLVDAASQTTNIANISLGKLNPFLVPLPPLEEQKRIVARIDELMSRCDELESLRSAQESKRRGARAAAVRQWLTGDDAAAALLGEHFATLVSSREDVAELRKVILQLAVMGKLVAQDPADAPASELLKQIAGEKAVLVKAGKIRTQKALSPIADTEKSYTIPRNWEWARLQEVTALVTDGDHQPPPKAMKGVPFLVIGNLNTGVVNFDGCRFVPNEYFGALDWGRKPSRGDILYSVTGSFGITIPVDTDEAFCVQRHVAIFKSAKSTPAVYLAHFLRSAGAEEFAERIATGIAQKTVPLSGLRGMPIPLPPVEEQKRIVARINTLMHLCDSLEHNIDTALTKQAELLDAVMARA